MSKMRKLYCLFVMLVGASLAHAQPVTLFNIDTFDNVTGSAADPTLDGSGVWSGFGPGITGVLGGNRVLGNYLTQTSGSPPFTNSAFVSSSGWFEIANPSNTRSGGEVIWQGNSTTPGSNPIISHPGSFANPLNLNFGALLTAPDFHFEWSVINADTRNWTYTIRAYTTSTANYYEASVTSSDSGVLLGINKNQFFVAAGLPNWNDIDAISFSASYTGGLLGGDLAIDFFQIAVPEMSTYLMIGLTLVLGGAIYARRYASKAEAKPTDATPAAEGTDVVTPAPTPEVPLLV